MNRHTTTPEFDNPDLQSQALLDERIERWIWRLLAAAVAALGLALLLLPVPSYAQAKTPGLLRIGCQTSASGIFSDCQPSQARPAAR